MLRLQSTRQIFPSYSQLTNHQLKTCFDEFLHVAIEFYRFNILHTIKGTPALRYYRLLVMPAETYHCVCGTLILVLPGYANLEGLPRRKADGLQETPILVIKSNIQPQPAILNSILSKTARAVRRPDGFEKRWLWRCSRCKVPWAYELRAEQDNEDNASKKVVCLLADCLTSTEALERAIDESGK